MSFPRYMDYVDSGTDWLGEYPSHWKVVPVWTLFRRTKRQGHSDEELLSVYRDYGVVPKSSRDDNNNKPSDDLSAYQLVNAGDLVINKMKAWQGSVAISGVRGIVSPAYFTYAATHYEDQRYLHYLMRSQRYITGYLSLSKGIRVNQWDLEPQYHSRMPVLLPPKDEQQRIASLLDSETAKIDALVEEQKRLIELLKEKRQAVISQALTKGLDPNVPMKDSGVQWLGTVPAHWLVGPLKHVVTFRSGGTPDKSRPDYWDGDVPWASAKDLKVEPLPDTADHISEVALLEGAAMLVSAGTVLVVVRGMILARTFPVVTAAVDMAINQDLKAVTARAPSRNDWLAWLLRASTAETLSRLDEAGHGTKALRMDAWGDMRVAVPPPDEQEQIASFLRSECERIDGLVSEADRAITLLAERRSSLVAAAVTGKIDVRGRASRTDTVEA